MGWSIDLTMRSRRRWQDNMGNLATLKKMGPTAARRPSVAVGVQGNGPDARNFREKKKHRLAIARDRNEKMAPRIRSQINDCTDS